MQIVVSVNDCDGSCLFRIAGCLVMQQRAHAAHAEERGRSAERAGLGRKGLEVG